MNERDINFAYDYHLQHHRQLIEIARSEMMLKTNRPKWSDHLLLRLGNSLISLGQKLRDSSAIARPADLTQECA